MASKILASLVAILAIAVLFTAGVSALSVDRVEVKGETFVSSGSGNIAVTAGEVLPIRVFFDSDGVNLSDVRVEAWISGDKKNGAESGVMDLVGRAGVYSEILSLKVPSDLDVDEDRTLFVLIEDEHGINAEFELNLVAQRAAYALEILDVNFASEVKAGDILSLDVVLKNIGRHFAEDTFVKAKIAALGIEDRAYFGDLSTEDQSNPDKEDTTEQSLSLRVPANAPAGVYVIDLEAYDGDSSVVLNRRVVVKDSSADSMVVSPVNSKSFNAGEKATYSLTLANSGTQLRVYELVIESSEGLNVNVDEPVVAVPAGTSRTLQIEVSASEAGTYNFNVNVHSGNALVSQERFAANVENASVATGNATVLLTVVLAIVFVVLLVVLIVLLTRKPQKAEEFGESYY